MPDVAKREFRVHARHLDIHHAHRVTEASFEAAAVAYLEDYPDEAGGGEAISVMVHEVSTGHSHCFRVDLESGETAPCV